MFLVILLYFEIMDWESVNMLIVLFLGHVHIADKTATNSVL